MEVEFIEIKNEILLPSSLLEDLELNENDKKSQLLDKKELSNLDSQQK